MTLHTPVVFTDDDATTQLARSRHWPVVSPDGCCLALTAVAQRAPLPEPRLDIAAGSLTSEAQGWGFVLDWVAKYVHRPMLVTDKGSWAEELAGWAAASRGWPLRLVADRSELSALPDEPLLEEWTPAAPSPAVRQPGTTRVLVVAHQPEEPRASAWLGALAHAEGVVTDLACPEPCDAVPRVHVIPDHELAALAPGRGPIEPVFALALQRASESEFDPLLQEAGAWQLALERWFEARDDHFDVVVLVGPPPFFGFAAWAQRVWYARTVLDYGSPYSHAAESDVRELAAYWERGWNLAADVVTVPEGGSEWAVASGPDARTEALADDDAERRVALVRELGSHTFSPPSPPVE